MMQGDPLSPTIFNVVVDVVVRHWVNGLVDEAEAKGEMGREGRLQSAVFYADDGMVVSSDPVWIQGAFNTLVAIFYRVVLPTLFRRPTLSKMATRALNAPWSQTGSDETTMPSLA